VLDGRHYIVSVNRRYTKRGVIRFAREVLRRELGIGIKGFPYGER
jgi:hypothetical protein